MPAHNVRRDENVCKWRIATRTDPTGLVDVSRLDAHLASQGIDDTRAIRANEARLGLAFESVHDLRGPSSGDTTTHETSSTHSDFVRLGDALGNANNQANLVLDCLDDGVGSARWRHVQYRCVRLCLTNGLRCDEEEALGGPCYPDSLARGLTSFTDPNTGKPRCVWPAFFGDTPPTILVPNARASFAWKVPCSRNNMR